jgi:hypothetical protein
MVIKDISRTEFIGRLSLHSDLEHFIGKEVDWFSNKRGNIIGTIASGDRSRGWNYVILKRNQTGTFHVRNVMCDFYNHAAARVALIFAMVGAGQSRRAQFPRMGLQRKRAEARSITIPPEGKRTRFFDYHRQRPVFVIG